MLPNLALILGMNSVVFRFGWGSETGKFIGGITKDSGNPYASLLDNGQFEQTAPTNSNSYKLQISASDTANIYINNIKAVSGTNYTFDIPSEGTSMVRILVQDGDSAPYITYFKVTKK